MRGLDWFPIRHRIHFKVLLFTFKAIHGIAPVYIRELMSLKAQGAYNLYLECCNACTIIVWNAQSISIIIIIIIHLFIYLFIFLASKKKGHDIEIYLNNSCFDYFWLNALSWKIISLPYAYGYKCQSNYVF